VETVYLNGTYVPYDRAVVSVEDRGLLFADGIYEVVRAYGGRVFALDAHLQRLAASAAAIRLPLPPAEELAAAVQGSLDRNGLAKADATVYIQVTRGPAPRAHTLPKEPRPTVFMIARPLHPLAPETVAAGVDAITLPDQRWHVCHVKSVGLLLNSLARQQAVEAGAFEAILVRDGVVTEGAATNVFAVFGGEVHTHPVGPRILSGITHDVVLRAAHELGLPLREEGVPVARLYQADEVFISSTNCEVLGVRSIDGRPVGAGRPGPVTRRLLDAFQRIVRSEVGAHAGSAARR
jgi:D-alanine transaminase